MNGKPVKRSVFDERELAQPASFDDGGPYNEPKFYAGFTITKVIRETVPLMPGVASTTYGQILDEYLKECAKAGQEVQAVEFEISQHAWSDYVSQVAKR